MKKWQIYLLALYENSDIINYRKVKVLPLPNAG